MTGKVGNGNLHGRKYEYGPVIDGDSLSAHPPCSTGRTLSRALQRIFLGISLCSYTQS